MTVGLIDHSTWSYDPETGIVTIGQVECRCVSFRSDCKPGRRYRFPWVPCKPCKGTGKRGNGKCSKCSYHRPWGNEPHRDPLWTVGHVPDYGTPVDDGPCQTCDGTLTMAGDGNARLPEDIRAAFYQAAPVEILATTQEFTRLESVLGITIVDDPGMGVASYGSLLDYGRRWEAMRTAYKAGGETWAAHVAALTAELAPSLQDDRRNVCGWAVCRMQPGGSYVLPSRLIAMVGPSGVRYLGVRMNDQARDSDIDAG
jgi:hypothetical protein